ncbi:MAG: hypothetical protein COA84_14370 [Robiginitomaculum sp.]|nr:MAG: hypothetical protein COA84_14370 [Robiginitomaculum sp.]
MGKPSLESVIQYWFDEMKPKYWFVCNAHIDANITARFGTLYEKLAAMKPAVSTAPVDTLARIIVLDQFPRNMFRNTHRAFATDALALALSKAGLEAGQDKGLTLTQKAFFYMPFMHSENADDQERSLMLFSIPGLEDNYRFAIAHKAVIDRFGRYPHRNAALGRASTAKEEQFLQEPDSAF